MTTKAAPVAEPAEPWEVTEKKRLVSELERLDAAALEAVKVAAEAGALARQRHAEVLGKRNAVLAELAKLKNEHPGIFQ